MAVERPLSAASAKRVLRPLLGVTRRELLAFAQARRLPWVEDDSNTDTAYARNFLRQEILPRIESRFPAYRNAIARAIANLQDEDVRAMAQAQDDLAAARIGNRLILSALRALGPARAVAVLRAFLQEKGLRAPARARLEELLRQAFDAKPDSAVTAVFEGGSFRRYRHALYWLENAVMPDPGHVLMWAGEAVLALPDGLGQLRFSVAQGRGIRRELCLAHQCTVRFRRGGDTLRLAPARPRRSLKNLLQESEIAPWERTSLPIFCLDEKPVWVAGLGYDCDALATPEEIGLNIELLNA